MPYLNVSNLGESRALIGQSTDNQVVYKSSVENPDSRSLVTVSSANSPKAQRHPNYQSVAKKQAVKLIAIKKSLHNGKVGQAIRDNKITRDYGYAVARALLFKLRTGLPPSHPQYNQQPIPLDEVYCALEHGLLGSAVLVGRIDEVRATEEALISLPNLGLDAKCLQEIFRKHVPDSTRSILTEK